MGGEQDEAHHNSPLKQARTLWLSHVAQNNDKYRKPWMDDSRQPHASYSPRLPNKMATKTRRNSKQLYTSPSTQTVVKSRRTKQQKQNTYTTKRHTFG
jgi:hypothetical protein